MQTKGQLLRVLGVVFGLAAVVGSVVGQGILRTPGLVAGAVPTPTAMIALWLLGGLIALVAGAVYVELGASLPNAGGPYIYSRRAFGERAASLTGLTLLLAMAVSSSNTAVVIGEYMVRLGVWPGGAISVPSTIALLLFVALNWSGTQVSGTIQIAFSALKGAMLIGLVVLIFGHGGGPAMATESPIGLGEGLSLAGIALALRLIVGTYNGWQDIVMYGEEMVAPEKSLPRAMFGGLCGVIGLYLLINLALLHVLTPAAMAASTLPAADAAGLVMGPYADTFVTAFGIVSVSALTSLTMMSTTRLAYALARDGILPGALSEVSAGGTPRRALLLVAAICIAFVAIGDYNSTSSTATTLYQFAVVLALLCAWQLRRTQPDLPRPWKMPLYPLPLVVALLANVGLFAAFVYDDLFNSLIGFVVVGTILLAQELASRYGKSPEH